MGRSPVLSCLFKKSERREEKTGLGRVKGSRDEGRHGQGEGGADWDIPWHLSHGSNQLRHHCPECISLALTHLAVDSHQVLTSATTSPPNPHSHPLHGPRPFLPMSRPPMARQGLSFPSHCMFLRPGWLTAGCSVSNATALTMGLD